ncbi:MAG: hypothetical protein IKE76_16400 [Clostridia bacterium]|nr:hypothetical protein [Clostridia bacterium]
MDVKKLPAVLIAISMLFIITAVAEDVWECPVCNLSVSGNFCYNCGAPKPSEDMVSSANNALQIAEGTVILDQEGVRVTLTGKVDTFGTMMMLEVIVENNRTEDIYVNVSGSSINGWDVFGVGIADISAGKKKKSDLSFNISDASIENPNQIENMEIQLSVANAKTWMTIFEADSIALVPVTGLYTTNQMNNSVSDSTLDQMVDYLSEELETKREQTDMANIRAAYAELVTEAITNENGQAYVYSKTIPLHQEVEGWQSKIELTLGNSGIDLGEVAVGKGKTVVLEYNSGSKTYSVSLY